MNKKLQLLSLATMICGMSAQAQLSSNPDKFLGNITTSYNVDYGNEPFHTLWNQITCENESKWASVEGNNNSFNWGGADRAYNYAKTHHFPFKFHALVWGSQYPSWIESMTPEQRYQEIVQWMDKAKEHYPDLQIIDVVNEAVAGHQAGTHFFEEALGGKGVTGYDWIINAFELAYERWPNAILIYNDFNTFQWNTDQYLDLVKTLRNAGAPIDAYGCQSHDLTDCSLTTFKNSMAKLQNGLKMPMYSTEYDIGTDNDQLQLQRYKEQIPYMWEQDYVAGVTLWGYIYGKTWTTNGNSGIIKDGKDRPAMTWLREYMQTDAAKNAKSPFPGMRKEASVYIKPAALNVEKGEETSVTVRAKMRTKKIEKIDFYVKNVLVSTMTEAPYEAKFTPTVTGKHELKAVVTTTDGNTYTRYAEVTSCNPRAPYKNTPAELPGVIQAENFDSGAEGIAFHDMNSNKEGTGASYRTDATGVDIEKGGTGYVLGYTQAGEWVEYTVDVKEPGYFSFDVYYSAPKDAKIGLSVKDSEGQTNLTANDITLPATGSWSTYKHYTGHTVVPLEAGKQILRLSIVGGEDTYITNIDKITFASYDLQRVPFAGPISVPGIIEAENFDMGIDGFTYHDSDAIDEGNSGYRTDNEGVDIKKIDSDGDGQDDGYAIGWNAVDEWYEYTIDVKENGKYSLDATVSSTIRNARFTVGLVEEDGIRNLWSITVPKTSTSTSTKYKVVTPANTELLTPGKHILRITVTGANFDIDKLELKCVEPCATPGDVNNDGTVDIADINAVIAVICGAPDTNNSADVNKDNVVDIADINAVISIICGN